jgi:hypothetical protein
MRDRTTILLEEAYNKVYLSEVALTSANVGKFNKKYQTNFTSDQLKDIFDRFNKQQPRLAIKDIYGYNSLQDLQTVIAGQSNKETVKSVKSNEVNVIINNDRLLVVEPLTPNASQLYGANTKWCTAAGKDNKFLFHAGRFPLVYFIDKVNNKKYAIANTFGFDQEDKSIGSKSILKRFNLNWNRDIKPKLIPLENKLSNLNGRYVEGPIERWYTNGKYDRKDGPATIAHFKNGNTALEVWYKNGVKHRDSGPAETQYYENGNKGIETWYVDGKLHRVDGPTVVTYYENGNKKTDEWCINDRHKHRYYSIVNNYNRSYRSQTEVKVDGEGYHREDGPAYIEYYENGNKKYEAWYWYGSRSPNNLNISKVWYNMDGTVEDSDKAYNDKRDLMLRGTGI